MADETVPATTPEAPQPEAAPEQQPATQPTPSQEPGPDEKTQLRQELARTRGAYSSLQQKYEYTLNRANASTALMAEMAENVKMLRESQTALVKSTMGEEQAQALDARMKAASEESQRQQAVNAAISFVQAQTRLFNESLQAAGVDTNSIQWPENQPSVEAWMEQAKAEVLRAISTSREKYIKAVETASAKAKEAAKAEAEKMADKELTRAGVGRIDSAKGSGTTLRQRIDALDPKSPEFAALVNQAKRGELTKF